MAKAKKSMRDKIRERAQQRPEGGGGGFATVQLPEGTDFLSITPDKKGGKEASLMLDFFPYIVASKGHPMADAGEEWFERTYFIHRDIGVDEKPYICPKSFKKRCPICDRRKVLMENYDENKDMIKALRPSERQLFNVIDQADNKVYVLDIAYPCFGEALEKELRTGKEEYSDFPNVKGGYTLKLRFDEAKIGTNPFWKVGRIDFEERGDYEDDIYSFGIDLDDCLIETEGDDLERIYLELDSEEGPAADEGDPGAVPEEEESTGPSRPSAPSRGKPKAAEPEEEKTAAASRPKPGGRGGRAAGKPAADKPAASAGRSRPTRPDKEKEAGEETCPSGGVFGEPDKIDACYECDTALWGKCKDKQEGIA